MSRCLVGKEEEGYFRRKGKLGVLRKSETFDVIRVSCEEELKLVGSQGPDCKGCWMPGQRILDCRQQNFQAGEWHDHSG